VALPAASWREIQDRASTLGIKAELMTWDEQSEPSPEARPGVHAASPSTSLTDQAPQPLTELRLVAEIADLPGAG
jgi:hypothetical protein